MTIEHNRVLYSAISHIGVMAGSVDCTVQRNLVGHGGFYSETMRHPGSSAINIHSSGSGIVVDGNFSAYQHDLTEIDGNGFIADLMEDGGSVLFRNNVAWRNAGAGLNFTESPGCVVVGNVFSRNHADGP
ncbi:MAG: hypothetical protein GY711_07735 [bacterium]|nr:hypothetical protein [bacterium]